jgi:osmoprotectant transport system substrate-binding protein
MTDLRSTSHVSPSPTVDRPPARRRRLAAVGLAAVCALGVAACGGDDGDAATDTTTDTTAGATTTTAGEATGGATISFRPLDVGGPLTVAALEGGDIDIALLFTTDGNIAANGWVVLADDQGLQAADNIVPLGRSEVLTDDVVAVLDPVTALLTTEALTAMNKAVDIDKEDPADVAAAWVADNVPEATVTIRASVRIGSFNFGESEVLANIYAEVLRAAGADVEVKAKLGSREVVVPALENGEIDLVPEYVASASSFFGGSPTSDVAASLADLNAAIAGKGLVALAAAPARNTNELVVTAETAERLGLTTISDLAGVSEPLTMGGPPECPERPFCLPGYAATYGLTFER